jgi:hypothetical protein
MRQYLVYSAIATLCTLSAAHAEVTDCTEIAALPATISKGGIYCLKGNVAYAPASGQAITVQAHNVTIDLNGFTLSNLSAGAGTTANAIYSTNQRNITVRNGTIRGFARAISFEGAAAGGHVIEDLRVDMSRHIGINIGEGNGVLVRNNYILNTTASGDAVGIALGQPKNVKILNNVISRTNSLGAAGYGIYIIHAGTQLVEIVDNSILDTTGAAGSEGIAMVNGQNVSIVGNRILNGASPGTNGIFRASGFVNCLNNFVARFTNTGFATCDFASGNVP